MKNIIRTFAIIGLITLSIVSCKKEEEGDELKLDLKTGSGYTYADGTIPGGTAVKIGIEAETDKKKDPIVKFNITAFVSGGASNSVYSEDLATTNYEYDYNFIMDTVSGSIHNYTFTITNKDGINKQKTIKLTVQ
jgi:hypothetical protein